ncbi:substrate-binding domain-containing protein [Hathewaya massiliensis]|uniref:substrate-binding domain-containing protein n=1 Tax=Hathewaya massiliensis TaxID=1964382 RepID=UPI00115A8172|nr:substrate-binding domain-containing protein [Hathewaya massiliensis]
MKKILVFFLIFISIFVSSCSSKKEENNTNQSSESSKITLYTDESLKPMIADISKDFNLNVNKKINFKTVSKAEVEKLIKETNKGKEDGKSSSKSTESEEIRIFIGYDIEKENYKSETIAKDGIAIISSEEFPMDNINIEKLRDIYSGKIKSLKEMENIDVKNKTEDKINFITLQENNFLRHKFDEKVMRIPSNLNYGEECTIVNSLEEALQKISDKNTIGYSNMQNIKTHCKVLKLNGVNFSKNSIEAGVYPLVYEIKITYKKEEEKSIEEFINYIKSDEGKKIIQNYCIGQK